MTIKTLSWRLKLHTVRWVKNNRPVKGHFDIELDAQSAQQARLLEREATLQMMAHYGYDKVRGGPYVYQDEKFVARGLHNAGFQFPHSKAIVSPPPFKDVGSKIVQSIKSRKAFMTPSALKGAALDYD